MKPLYEKLEAELRDTKAQLEQNQSLLKLALERILKLEERLKQNFKNSSKAPSTDQKANTSGKDKDKKKRKFREGKARQPIPPEKVDHSFRDMRFSQLSSLWF